MTFSPLISPIFLRDQANWSLQKMDWELYVERWVLPAG
ncbi:MAG: hypothetical protein H6P99_1691 [Holophagaceae bacterium]|nr:hypothetical protein [Holophagaceae bacterium]